MKLSYKDRNYIDKKLEELTCWKEIEKVVWSSSMDIKYLYIVRAFVRKNLEKTARAVMKRAALNTEDWHIVVSFVSSVIYGDYSSPGDSFLFEKYWSGELI